MRILSNWIRSYVPGLSASDRELADALTLRGIAVEGVFDLAPGQGSLFEMDITTNRVDAMNHYGIAREAAAMNALTLAPLDVSLPDSIPGAQVEVSIEAPDLCGRFTARALAGVCIQPSSGLVLDRFNLLEQKPISNAVDATNYVTLAIGHPTHAFDRDKLMGGIILRRARKGEKLRLLDGTERILDSEDLVVADEVKAIALAGVMGGWDTMITPETKNVLVEAAWFDPLSVRRSSKRHGLHTEASHRFERGADFEAPPVASALVSQLILSSGGSLEGGLVDVVVQEARDRTSRRPFISLAYKEVDRILGSTEDGRGIEQTECESILRALGCGLENDTAVAYRATPPSWRLDLEREIDLIEEIARVYGYNRFADSLPAYSGAATEPACRKQEAKVRETLLSLGWTEAISSTFCSAQDAGMFSPGRGSAVSLGNPLSEEAGILRPSLVPGMLGMLANNLNRNVSDVQLFEIGTVFSGDAYRVEERPALALGATGVWPSGPHFAERALDYFDLKGALEDLLAKFADRDIYFDAFPEDPMITPAWLHPYRCARVVAGGETSAWIGQLHPDLAQRRKFKQDVFVGEIYLDRLYRLPLRQPVAREQSRFQLVRRDFSFIFPQSVRWANIANTLEDLRLAELSRYAPREIFHEGKGKSSLPAGHYSMLIGVTFQALDRTLREEELQEYSLSIRTALEKIGGKLRG